METAEFIERAKVAGRLRSPAALELAIEAVLLLNPNRQLQHGLVADVVTLAAQYEQVLAGLGDSAALDLSQSHLTAITSDRVCRCLEPRMAALRESLFNSTKTPFATEADAIRWIESASKTVRPTRKGALKKASEHVRAIETLTGTEVSLRMPLLRFPKRQGKSVVAGSVPAPKGTVLHRLARGVEGLAEDSGFHAAAVTWWVLLGKQPVLPGVTVRQRQVFAVPRPPQLAIEINRRDLSWDDLRKIYDKYRKALSPGRSRKVAPRTAEILEAVRALGGVPDRGKTQFWRRLVEGLAKKGRLPAAYRWESARKAYYSAIGTMEVTPAIARNPRRKLGGRSGGVRDLRRSSG